MIVLLKIQAAGELTWTFCTKTKKTASDRGKLVDDRLLRHPKFMSKKTAFPESHETSEETCRGIGNYVLDKTSLKIHRRSSTMICQNGNMNPETLLLKEIYFSVMCFVRAKFIHAQSNRSTRGFLLMCASHSLFSSKSVLFLASNPLLQTWITIKLQVCFIWLEHLLKTFENVICTYKN